jgi:restriction system protein
MPDYESPVLPLLSALADGEEHEVATLRDRIAASRNLTDTDRAELLPSGKQSMFDNRIGWAKFYLDKAGLVVSTRRGVYKITDLGRQALGQEPSRIDGDFLNQFDSFREFVQREREDDQELEATPEPSGAATPEEVLETAYRQIRKKVEADLLVAVAKASPRFFEKLVVELLVKMGYGGDIKDAGKALGRSHDGSLDGLIKEDHLGLDAIYIQAKRWQAASTASMPGRACSSPRLRSPRRRANT